MLSGCFWVSDAEYASRFDSDGDGIPRPEDCDDSDPNVSVEQTFYGDADGDGFGGLLTQTGCTPATGYSPNAGDCNDEDPRINPGAEEICNDADDDCDASVDEGVEPGTWYRDVDGDGFGNEDRTKTACDQPFGYTDVGTDCDDKSAAVNPDAIETCSGEDDDCDGLVDSDDPDMAGDATWYWDGDGDGAGNNDITVVGCDQPAGYVRDGNDCDDADEQAHPGAVDLCEDGLDQDCDGIIDNTVLPTTYYADADGDGFGDFNADLISTDCQPPPGYAPNDKDCDDFDPSVNPNADELCNGFDDDCDGALDDDDPSLIGLADWYSDGDSDGFGDADTTVQSCAQPPGMVSDDSDCDDAAASVNPGADEVCNGIDDDCNGLSDGDDSGVSDEGTWYLDSDGDAYGDSTVSVVQCDAPAGYVEDGTDCDDGDLATHPGALDLCADGIDQDCDGTADNVTSPNTWYADVDGDGYGDSSTTTSTLDCAPPAGYVFDDSDCDDADSGVHPAALETCDGIDNDCDGGADDADPQGADGPDWYADTDDDDYGDLSTAVSACSMPADHVADSTDCDDTDDTIHPGALENCDGVDTDCDGAIDQGWTPDGTLFYQDSDGDLYGDVLIKRKRCVAPAGFVADSTDCDDTNGSINPGETEICNGWDDDCDPSTVEPAICPKIAFVSSKAFQGDLGGLDGADQLCQDMASDAGLSGTFRAWLSDSTGSPSTRFTPSAEPYALYDGTQIAANWADLTDGALDVPIDITETGGTPPTGNWCGAGNAPVWSHTTTSGAYAGGGESCNGWRTVTGEGRWGNAFAATSQWTAWCDGSSGNTCGLSAPLYCFQQ